MTVFLKFLAAMAVFWCGVVLVQPHSAFLSFVVFGLALWLMVEVMIDAATILFTLTGRR